MTLSRVDNSTTKTRLSTLIICTRSNRRVWKLSGETQNVEQLLSKRLAIKNSVGLRKKALLFVLLLLDLCLSRCLLLLLPLLRFLREPACLSCRLHLPPSPMRVNSRGLPC